MSLLAIASIACAQFVMGPLCFTDLDGPLIFAYDQKSNVGLVITREPWTETWYGSYAD